MNSTVFLTLPGMTLNSTIFPEIGRPRVEVDFTTLVTTPTGELPAGVEHGMDLYADLLDGQLEREPDWTAAKRVIVAHSFGGMLALWWLLRHRCSGLARIDGLVFVATTAGPMFDVVSLRIAKLGPFAPRIGVNGPIVLWNLPVVTKAVKRVMNSGSLEARRVDFSRLARKTDLALDLAGWRNTDWRAIRTFRIAMMGFDVRARLGEIDVPTVVLHGSEDAILPPDVGERLAAAMPNAQFRLVDGAGHGLPLTHPAPVIEAVQHLTG